MTSNLTTVNFDSVLILYFTTAKKKDYSQLWLYFLQLQLYIAQVWLYSFLNFISQFFDTQPHIHSSDKTNHYSKPLRVLFLSHGIESNICWGVKAFSKMLIKQHLNPSIYGSISSLFLPPSVLVIRRLLPCSETPTLPVSPRSLSLLIHSKYQNSGRVCPLGHFDEILKSAVQRERQRGMGLVRTRAKGKRC